MSRVQRRRLPAGPPAPHHDPAVGDDTARRNHATHEKWHFAVHATLTGADANAPRNGNEPRLDVQPEVSGEHRVQQQRDQAAGPQTPQLTAGGDLGEHVVQSEQPNGGARCNRLGVRVVAALGGGSELRERSVGEPPNAVLQRLVLRGEGRLHQRRAYRVRGPVPAAGGTHHE